MEEKYPGNGPEEMAGETDTEGMERETVLKMLQDALDEAAAQSEAEPGDSGENNCKAEEDDENEGGETERLRAELEETKNSLAQARADMYNYRQRVERDRVRSRKRAAEDTVCDFLPVLDNLDRALCVPEDGSAKDVLIGVRMVRRQFLTVLEEAGVTAVVTEGCSFDPAVHDAVETEYVDDPELNGVILCELLSGYKTSDRVLRPAQVRVGKLRDGE